MKKEEFLEIVDKKYQIGEREEKRKQVAQDILKILISAAANPESMYAGHTPAGLVQLSYVFADLLLESFGKAAHESN